VAKLLLLFGIAVALWAQPMAPQPQATRSPAPPPPRFEDFPVDERWNGPNAPIKLVTRSERMFRTQLTEGSKGPPTFAGHYRFTGWGCGSVCAAGAIIDLKTGTVYPPPGGGKLEGWDRWIFSHGFVDGPFDEYRLNSRLIIVRKQAMDPAKQTLTFFEWTGDGFRKVAQVLEKRPSVTAGK
jgi:hypothetical protein